MSEKLLDKINSPSDLRELPVQQLPQLAGEIRDMMIDVVSHTGGHLAPSLGTVELTLALHYCFNTPEDKLVWDVGHQAYTHKILTNRKESFRTLRQLNGISGFPRISESEYDALSVGHASTSISAALGMARGRDLLKQDHSVVAIIGDGSLSGGLAFEGLNNLGSSSTNMTVVLNDNEMSISKNVGAISRYLTKIMTDKRYNKIKKDIWEMLGGTNVGKSVRNMLAGIDTALKHIVIPGKLFEDMGIRYLGPIDGHNIEQMIEVFNTTKNYGNGPLLVHIITKKGKGFEFAEKDATKYHGIGSFSRDTGETIKSSSSQIPTYSDIFGKTMVELAPKRPELVAITA
ncbi:MAG: 1-deoxy-D-xylulose-5-phosphate synthase N-terminal domain-containing protein, partial [Fibrobacter sp.]|nr:1-deoxy-D-xylulose-5-phosphate synthase N-terminal domain-containing protein [Fibrobacter sp.]